MNVRPKTNNGGPAEVLASLKANPLRSYFIQKCTFVAPLGAVNRTLVGLSASDQGLISRTTISGHAAIGAGAAATGLRLETTRFFRQMERNPR